MPNWKSPPLLQNLVIPLRVGASIPSVDEIVIVVVVDGTTAVGFGDFGGD